MLKFQKQFQITSWDKWKKDISKAVNDFAIEFSIHPNILQTNGQTGSQIDSIVNMDEKERINVTDIKNTKKPREGEGIILDAFYGDGYNLEFALDDHLPDQVFRLIYDDSPEWEEDIPDNTPKMALQLPA